MDGKSHNNKSNNDWTLYESQILLNIEQFLCFDNLEISKEKLMNQLNLNLAIEYQNYIWFNHGFPITIYLERSFSK